MSCHGDIAQKCFPSLRQCCLPQYCSTDLRQNKINDRMVFFSCQMIDIVISHSSKRDCSFSLFFSGHVAPIVKKNISIFLQQRQLSFMTKPPSQQWNTFLSRMLHTYRTCCFLNNRHALFSPKTGSIIYALFPYRTCVRYLSWSTPIKF